MELADLGIDARRGIGRGNLVKGSDEMELVGPSVSACRGIRRVRVVDPGLGAVCAAKVVSLFV